jgi:hypothetical protein
VTDAAPRRPGKEPNFFLVGASRAGTTSLWDYLGQHPDVFFPAHPYPKEPSHFCDVPPIFGTPYRDLSSYLRGFESASGQAAIGEASTTYLPSPESPGRIHARYPDARIIIVLRNPADRAHSLYKLLCQLGFEWITPFERALAVEDARASDPRFRTDNPFWYYAYLYFRTGLYAEQVERWLGTFPAAQVKVLLFESLRNRPRETSQDVYRFLGIDPAFVPKISVQNQGAYPLWVRGQRLLTRVWKTHPLKPPAGPPDIVDRLLGQATKANLLLGRLRRHELRSSTRVDLLRRYASDIVRTGSLIGIDLEPWTHGREVPE